MSKINHIIPPSNFETIRDLIGSILTIELNNQFVLTSDNVLNTTVFAERHTPLDINELSYVSVNVANGEYDNKHQGSVRAEYNYFVDVYTTRKSQTTTSGQKLSIVDLHKLLGVCRAILENEAYKTLGVAPPFVASTIVSSMSIAEPNNEDARNISMGRLEYQVTTTESTRNKDAIQLDGITTKVKIELTDKGYVYG